MNTAPPTPRPTPLTARTMTSMSSQSGITRGSPFTARLKVKCVVLLSLNRSCKAQTLTGLEVQVPIKCPPNVHNLHNIANSNLSTFSNYQWIQCPITWSLTGQRRPPQPATARIPAGQRGWGWRPRWTWSCTRRISLTISATETGRHLWREINRQPVTLKRRHQPVNPTATATTSQSREKVREDNSFEFGWMNEFILSEQHWN